MEIGVYGLGRFGTFWASLLAQKHTVKGFNRTPGKPFPPGVLPADETSVVATDIFFLCVAISSMEEVLKRIAPSLKPGMIFCDTCSVKVFPVELMRRYIPETVNVIGTHPMFGPDSGRGGVEGLPFVLCPVKSSQEAISALKSLLAEYRLRIIDLSPAEHDRQAAYTQGITHFIGRVLEDLELRPSRIGTVGFSKILEIIEQTCNDPWQLFYDLQRYNPFTGEMRSRLRESLDRIMAKLEASLDSKKTQRYDCADTGEKNG
ncbi:MAG: prephenate dehydrogenase/arogenate dehydrogenase family protein [Spirochaetota bacterium]